MSSDIGYKNQITVYSSWPKLSLHQDKQHYVCRENSLYGRVTIWKRDILDFKLSDLISSSCVIVVWIISIEISWFGLTTDAIIRRACWSETRPTWTTTEAWSLNWQPGGATCGTSTILKRRPRPNLTSTRYRRFVIIIIIIIIIIFIKIVCVAAK